MPAPEPAADKGQSPAAERVVLAGAWGLILAPVLAHGLWRPLIAALDTSGNAAWVTIAALVVAAVGAVATWRWPGLRLRAAACASATAMLAADGMRLFGGGSPSETLATGAALLAVAGFVTVALPVMIARTPAALDGQARAHRGATLAVAVLLSLTVLQSARLSTFMGDQERVQAAASNPVVTRFNFHSCLTAYLQGAKLANERAENLYDEDWWPAVGHTSTGEAQAQLYAPFDLDTYAYPPPFLLVPRFLLLAGEDFVVQRALWYGLNALWLAFGLWYVAAWIAESDPGAGIRALLLWPLIWVSFPTLITLQLGNVHLAVVVMGVVAMVAFERGQPALGGALLAFAVLAKISPGLLGVMLLVQRRWREALWTAGFGLAWTLLALLAFGPAPFRAFVHYQLPRLSSGAALEFFAESVQEVASNLAPFGLPFKLEALGIGFDDVWASAAAIGTVFTIVVVGLTIIAGLRRGDRRLHAAMWLAVLTLGGLRSPFAPGYVALGAIWLVSLGAAEVHRTRDGILLGLFYVTMSGLPLTEPVAMLSFSLVQQAALLAALAWVILRRPPRT
ncbi:hypothetical protein DB30_06024 [Enhygromyxa salina]|uniref:DUF2029 domain-containing protein n=1 Tax=Enhygromyxa salina TaxID=215803 RepID=A0A0C2CVJ3_9BACT|nr:glycosyltransferase family 87 protein [Enhygromyxa salina]KIG15116.1 hypothetical protein DB30_06024 [Enhygromyxa salina]